MGVLLVVHLLGVVVFNYTSVGYITSPIVSTVG